MKRDFRGYRKRMLVRRVTRRMAIRHIDRIAGYVDFLRTHPDEVRALGKDLSIGVTAFFREPARLPGARTRRDPGVDSAPAAKGTLAPVRVWVPGCATGEEAYSIAMLFLEQFAAAKKLVQSPDLRERSSTTKSLDWRGRGIYPDSIASEVSAERLQRFFVRTTDRRYQVSKALRELITFAPQNVIRDAPFSKLDLVACRNVLIYLEPDVQAKIIALFHFALLDGGYLLLGPAGVDRAGHRPVRTDLEEMARVPPDRIGPPRRRGDSDPAARRNGVARVPRAQHWSHGSQAAVGERLHRALLADFAPAAVLINRRHEILSVQGPVVDYLEFPPGELTRDLLSMARSGLRTAIRAACQQALQDHRAVVDADARVKRQGTYVPCTVTARPVSDAKDADGLLLVTFKDRPARRRVRAETSAARRLGAVDAKRHRSSSSSNTSSRPRARICRARSTSSRARTRS